MHDLIGLVISAPLSVMFTLLGLPLYLEKVRRNYFFGYRISHYAMLDDEIWYAVNKQGGKYLIIIGAFLALNSMFALIFIGKPATQKTILYANLVITVAGVLYSVIRGRILNNRLAMEKGLTANVPLKTTYKN